MPSYLILGSKSYPKVKSFANTMSLVSSFTTNSSHSNYGHYHLEKEMQKEQDKCCIEAAGAQGTWFSTFAINTESVHVMHCWAMKCCFDSNVLKFEVKGS